MTGTMGVFAAPTDLRWEDPRTFSTTDADAVALRLIRNLCGDNSDIELMLFAAHVTKCPKCGFRPRGADVSASLREHQRRRCAA